MELFDITTCIVLNKLPKLRNCSLKDYCYFYYYFIKQKFIEYLQCVTLCVENITGVKGKKINIIPILILTSRTKIIPICN